MEMLSKLPLKLLLESGDCTQPRFTQEFANKLADPNLLIIAGDLQSFRLHPVNRWLKWLDPEMWEITSPPESCDQTPRFLPKPAIIRLIGYLCPTDLKSSRLVSPQWNEVVSTSKRWTDKTVAVIDGNRSSWSDIFQGGIGATCASYLGTSQKRFCYWTQLRLRQLTTQHLQPLLTFHASNFRRSVKKIDTLEIHGCTFDWADFLELIDLFGNLRILKIDKCNFKLHNPLQDELMYSLGLLKYPTFQETLEEVSTKCMEEDYLFQTIKSLTILEDDSASDEMTPMLLALLRGRTGRLDEFELKLGRGTAILKHSNEQNQYWQSVHSFLASKNVMKCRISSKHNVSSGMVNRFFMYLNMWKFPPPGDDTWRLTELVIDLRPLALWNSFHKHLIPLLQRLPNLEDFFIKMVVLRVNRAHFLKDIIDYRHSDCGLKIGLILDDQGGPSAATLEKELLTPDLQMHLVALEVLICTDGIREIRDMVPYNKDVQYPSVEEFTFSTNAVCRPRFFTFNVNMIVHNFPNLTDLRIVDGPSFEYNSMLGRYFIDAQWKDMSGAAIGDEDMQLILTKLVKLKRLVLRGNMKYMTDTGFTGLAGQYCRRLSERNVWSSDGNIPALDLIHMDGVSVSNLECLEYFSIDGVGPKVTDVTAFLGFTGLKSLKILGLNGSHKISSNGKEYLQRTFSENSQCDIFVN